LPWKCSSVTFRAEGIHKRRRYSRECRAGQSFPGLDEEAFDVRLLRNVRLNGNRLAPGRDFIDDFVRSGFAGSVMTTTAAPSAARCLAIEAPMPLDAPVTTATLPVSFFVMS